MAKSATIDILGTGGLKHTAVYEEGSVRKFELMKEDYVRLVFHTNERFAVSLGDYIVTEWGTFYITKPQKPVFNTSTGGYDYDLQFDAPHYRWNNRLYKFEPNTNRNEASWSLTDNLRNQMAVFLRNLENLGFEYTVDPASYEYESASNNVYLVFENCYLLDALTNIAEAFGLEWWITDNIIHIGKCSKGTPVDFTIGVNVEDMGSEKSSKEYYTRLYAFGSTQNVPVGYRKNDEQVLLNGVVQKRIMMPTVDENGKAVPPYVEVEGVESEDEVVEAIVIFDDVKPKTDNKVTDLKADRREVEKTDTVEAGNGEGASVDSETETVTIYRFKDESLKFSEKFILPGVQLQAQFQSGALNGMTFDLAFNPDAVPEKKTVEGEEVWNEDAQWFEIVRNETYGVMLPNDTLKPARNDKFIILGWDVRYIEEGMELVTKAEQELRARALKKVEEMQLDNNVYPCTMMADYMYGLDNKGNQDPTKSKVGTFPLGQKVRLNNDNFFVGGSRVSRVVGYEYKLDIPYDHAIIYVGEASTYSSKAAQQAQINEVLDTINYRGGEYSGMGIGGSGIYVITTNDKTAPTDSNVYSAMKSEKSFARKDVNDTVSALWTFTRGNGARRGIQSKDYSESGANEDNLFGKGFELVERTNEHGDTRSRLEVDELFVRVKAFFSSLEIREMSYLGGNYAFSSAGGKIYYVEWLDALDNILTKTAANLGSVAKFRCYLYSDDGTTATVNKWRVDDQAMCRTFNIDEGVHEGTSNKYYWRRIIAIGKGVIANAVGTESEATEYHYVDISNMTATDYDVASDYPEEEDTIVQMGNWSDPARQGLILLKVEGEDSPAIIEYSGIGANGNHFVLPEPTLQLSPKRNIIYGEFHSVVNSSTGGEGSGETIDDQLRALLDALNDIKQQADQKFDIWFGNGIPLPNVSRPTATANYPASEWTTPELKALHAQDLFYDQDREPAKNGGRAWRWVAYDNNGQVGYYWQEVTDADTLAALEQISDVASDGKLTGGAEKTRVFIEWRKAVEDWSEYMERAEDYGITTERGDLNDAFKALGKLLNGGTDLVIGEGNAVETPLWLTDLTTTTVIPSAENYRNAWNRYYSCLSILLQTITAKAKELADNAQETADNAVKSLEAIASDNKIDKTEIADIKHEFIAMLHEFWDEGGLKDQACDEKGEFISHDVSEACQDTEDAMKAIGTFLNGGTNWRYITVHDRTSTKNVYCLDWEQTLANLPLYLKSTYEYTEPITIDGDAFVTLWGTYYKCRASILGILADEAHKAANEADQKAQGAQDEIDTITADGILSRIEKKEVRRDWNEIVRSYTRNNAIATMFGVSSSDYAKDSDGNGIVAKYALAYAKLGQYLDGSEDPDKTSKWTWVEGNIPSWIAGVGDNGYNAEGENINTDTEIIPADYRRYWADYYDAECALLNAISSIAKKAGDDALTKLEDIASDGKVTPSEKNTILVQWLEISKEVPLLMAQADQLKSSARSTEMATSINNKLTAYTGKFSVLGNYLNDGNYSWSSANIPLPSWITAENMDKTVTLSQSQKSAYIAVWSDYFTARTDLQNVFADASKEPGLDALGALDNLADDDILTEFEKLTVLREWDAISSEKADLINKAKMAHVSSEMYELRYNILGNFLNNPTASAGKDITTAFSGTPEALTTSGNTTISGWQFKANWSNFYAERTALLSAISTSKTSYYVGVNVPSTPYYKGDIWMKLASSTDTRGIMMLCIRDNETETADEKDWANMTDQLRDPLTILSKIASIAWSFMSGYIKECGSISLTASNTQPQSATKGDVWYKANSNLVYQYMDDGWEIVNRTDLANLGGMLYLENGTHTYKIFSSPVTSGANKYDMCVRNITFTEPMSGKTVEGNLEIQAYIGSNWIVLQDSTKAMIENYANQINSYMFGSENGYIKASGIITKTNITEMFASATNPSGEIVTKAYISAYTKDFVTEEGMKSYISGVKISADQIELTGTDKISVLVQNAVSNAVGPNLISNSLIGETSTAYGFAKRSVRLERNQKYTLSANGLVPLATSNNNMELRVYIWRFVDQTDVNADSTKRLGVDWANSASFGIQYNNGNAQTGSVVLTTDRECEYHICAYLYYKGGTGSAGDRTQPVTLNWLKLEKGELATEWVPGSNDEVLWKNYIVNPRAVDGTFATDGSCSKVTDPTFGEVVNISHEGNSNWQLRFTAGNGYESLVGKTVTFYVICKNDSGYEPHTGDNRKQLRFGGGDENVSALDTTNAPFVDLGNGWRKYYSTRTIKTGLMSNNAGTDTKIIGINCVMGNWKVYTVGVVLGGTCPSTQEIMNQSGLIATGIDIQNRSIELRADKVKFTSSDGKVSNKIWIDPTTGALNATDGNFSGKFRSYNPTTWNEINIDAYSGALVMKGPSSVQDDNRDLPSEVATQTELFRLEFQTDPDTLRRVANMRLNGLGTYASIDGIDGFYFGEGYGEGKRHFSIDLYGISYSDADGHYYSMSWEGLLRKIS